jgi:hypothetical protein
VKKVLLVEKAGGSPAQPAKFLSDFKTR